MGDTVYMTINLIINIPNHPSICQNLLNIPYDFTNNGLNILDKSCNDYNNQIIIPSNILFDFIKSITKIDCDFRLIIDGSEVFNNTYLYLQCIEFITINILYKLLGGKGGFGASLRGAKGRKKTSFNIDSCRDLQGRRIRQTRLAEKINEWKDANLTKEQLEILKTSSTNPTSYPEPITNSKGYKVQFSLKKRRDKLLGKLDESYINKKDIAINAIVPIDATKSQSEIDTSDIPEYINKSVEDELNSMYGFGTSTSYHDIKIPTINPNDKCNKISLGAKLAASIIKN